MIIAHSDADGITSAFVFSRILERLGFEYKKNYRTWLAENAFRNIIKENNSLLENLRKNNYIFFLDYSLEDYSSLSDKYVCTIDHHRTGGKPNILVNPAEQLKPDELPSASALVYALYKHMFDSDEIVKKIAFLGALGDLMVYNSLPYLGTDEKDPDLFVQKLPQSTYYHMMTIFNLKNADPKNDSTIYEYLRENIIDSVVPLLVLPEEFMSQIDKIHKKERTAIKKALNKIEKFDDKKIVFLETGRDLFPHYERLKGTLHALFPNYTVFMFGKLENNMGYRASGRSQTKTDLTKLIEYLKTKIPDLQGGGHPFAAGFFFKPKYLNKVKTELLENVDKFPRTN